MKTAGLDLGDRSSHFVVLDGEGQLVEEGRVATREPALRKRFSGCARMRIALETGTHSPWVSRLLEDCGHEVIVANSRKLRLIYENRRKNDRVDAMYLARLARLDPQLLWPIAHRGPEAQKDLALLRSRDALVVARTQLINHSRGLVKSIGQRLPSCSSEAFARKALRAIPGSLQTGLLPVLEMITSLNAAIKDLDRRIDLLAQESYPETKLLRQVTGVGPITSLGYVLILEDPRRFRKSRAVGSFLGLAPGSRSSGNSDPQMRITKEGDAFLRRLLVSAAQYILGPFGPDTDLRRFGSRIAQRGGKNAKKRAVVAVARKLAVLLHHLWRSGEVYEPLYQETRKAAHLGKIA
ncbi:MAG: IS110 family RNA-guided transposase [Isosphaeraceae bacterium]